ncbi:MAG: hypothetical protein WCZ47_04150 [Bacilli bacterium]|nr:hypothetical protein [Bacilli bacterium]NLN79865.1 guanylate kinase [Erysipelotrichia bacterium]
MIVLVGASASGKTEIAKILYNKYKMVKAITHTTRPQRKKEVNGVDYFFVSKDEFLHLEKQNAFVETTEYSGQFYGCTKAQVAQNKIVIVDPNGLRAFLNLNDKHIITFLISSDEGTRYERMLRRGDNIEQALSRIKNDRDEFHHLRVGYVHFEIINEDNTLEQAADRVFRLYNSMLRNLNLKPK